MKGITMGITEERVEPQECIRRLKRWFIGWTVAFNEASWPEDEQRTRHLKYGGRRMHELASDSELNPLHGIPDDELDDWCRSVV